MAGVNLSMTVTCTLLYLMLGAGPGNTVKLPANQCLLNDTKRCGLCEKPIDVTIVATNSLVDPNFDINVTITAKPQRQLVYFLEQAAEADPQFKFESTYYPTLGYFIDSINHVRGFNSNKTFWHIISVNGVGSLECGASSYVPIHEEVILFNFTTWAAAGFDY